MTSRSFRFPKSSSRLFAAALCSLALSGACSSDEDAPVTPITFGVEVTKLDGHSPDDAIQLRCDGTLVVAVATTPVAVGSNFVLRPAHACGASTRCGYVRIEALDDAGQVVASVDTATTEGVLELDLAQPPTEIRARLIRGLDQKPLLNPDKTEVTASVTPNLVVPTCSDLPGAGGAASAGVGGAAAGGEPNAGGATSTPVGGAGGDGAVLTPGGAGGADATDNASGAGGA